MKEPKQKENEITDEVPLLKDGTDTPAPSQDVPENSAEVEAALYKQADNPLGDPHKIKTLPRQFFSLNLI